MRILIVCSGNTCRSPFAAVLLRQKAVRAGISLEVQSAGTAATGGRPMSLPMEILLQEKGLEADHCSQRVTPGLLAWANVILTMTQAHKALITSAAPKLADRVFTLKEYAGEFSDLDIEDPIGADLASYRCCATEIEEGCDRILARLHPSANLDA